MSDAQTQQILKQLEHMHKLVNDAYLLVAGMRGQLEGMIADLRATMSGQQSLFDETESGEGEGAGGVSR